MRGRIAVLLMAVGLTVFFAARIPFARSLEDELAVRRPLAQSIIVDGDEVEYLEREKRIIATGNVTVRYGEVTLKCDRIEVDTNAQEALCIGNVRIDHPKRGLITGERIVYDIAQGRGFIADGAVEAYPWFGRAEKAERVSRVEYFLKDGYITTCDHDAPHYRLRASEVRIFPDDKVVAKNVVMYLGKVPVMWFPYYHQPIWDRRPKVRFVPGRSSDWGNFLLSAWRFHLRGDSSVDVLFDYRSKKGFAEGADLYYSMGDLGLEGLGKGLFRAYFVHQNDRGTYDRSAFRDDEDISPTLRKRFQWKHRTDFDDSTRMLLEFNKYSDEHMLKDYFFNEYEQLGTIPRNYISFTHARPNYTLSVDANARFHRFYTVTQKLPEVRLNIPDQRLWQTPFYYSATHTATAFDKLYAFKSQDREHVMRLDSHNQLSYVTRLGPLQLVPFGTFRNTAYSRTATDSQEVNRVSIGGGLNASTRFFRVFNVHTNILGIAINNLRHLISPQLRYTHLHQPTVSSSRLYQMDGVDGIGKVNKLELALENKLQTKRGAPGRERSVDLVRFLTSVDYHFDLKKDNLAMQDGGRFRDLKFDLELRPYDWLYVDSRLEVTPENQAVRRGFVEAMLRPIEDLAVSIAYRYEKDLPHSTNVLTFDAGYQINPKWRVGLYERFNLEKAVIEEQQLSITRDLHCWEVELVYNVEGSRFFKDQYTVWLAFRLKAFPDLQLGLSRAFSKRPPGSLAPGEGGV